MNKAQKLIEELIDLLREENRELKQKIEELERSKNVKEFNPRVINGGLSPEEDEEEVCYIKLSPEELELWVKNNIS